MAISKIVFKSSPSATGETWMDATQATAEAADITAPKTAMLANGILTTGTGTGGSSEMQEKYTTIKKLPLYGTEIGYLKDDGTISTEVSGGVIKKYTIPNGTTSIIINGLSELYAPAYWAVYWFVNNDTMVSYYSPVSTTELFMNRVVSVPTGATEFWSTEVDPYIMGKLIEPDGSQWKNKTWYSYGTSITDTSSTGKYPVYLAQMSGLRLVDKGIAGGGIGNLGGYSTGQVYSAICNITDGKLDADLITLETGANDDGASVPLGTVYDTGTSTLAGCLNDCLRYLQTNTSAQIVVTFSPASTTVPNATDKYYEWEQMVERICRINRVHYLSPANGMGYAKLTSTSAALYVEDNIHQTKLGGYIMAENLWNQLKNVPLFYTSMPNDNDDDESGNWTTYYNGLLNINNTDDGSCYYIGITSSDYITENSVWKITWNGVPFECTATSTGDPDGIPYAIGNNTIVGLQGGNGEPFFIQKIFTNSIIVFAKVAQKVSIKIQRQIT